MTHIISEWFLEAANHTCGPYDPDVDEMKLANLTPMPSKVVRWHIEIACQPYTTSHQLFRCPILK